ncbi:MAG: 50S ribosomal protein L15 [Patescibacteria group bacterium]
MQLHNLRPKHALTGKQPRIGRGGKRGTSSGRGTKGQGAHGGRRIPSGLKEILGRLPKLRGFKNKPKSDKPQIINIEDLAKIDDKVINRDVLFKNKLIKNPKKPVKILGDGEIKKAVTLEGLIISKSAKIKIEKANGKISTSI